MRKSTIGFTEGGAARQVALTLKGPFVEFREKIFRQLTIIVENAFHSVTKIFLNGPRVLIF